MKAFGEVPREYYHYFYPDHRSQGGMAYEDDPKPLGTRLWLGIVGLSWPGLYEPGLPAQARRRHTRGRHRQAASEQLAVPDRQEILLDRDYRAAWPRRRQDLRAARLRNVETRVGDGYFGWPEVKDGFDVIIVTCAAQYAPPDLFKQLKPGGRMLIPIGQPFKRGQILYVYTKDEDGKVHSRKDVGVFFIPMTGAMMNRPHPAGAPAGAPAPAAATAPAETTTE